MQSNTYSHGGDILGFAKMRNINPSDVIDLSSNINFIKPNISLDYTTLDISSYPNYDEIYSIIAKHFGLQTSELELFNGGSSAIFELFRTLRTHIQDCTIYSPAYLEYKKASHVFGYKLHLINRFNDIFKPIPQNSLVIFVNPSTPDGKYYGYDKKILKKLFKIWQKANATVLIDESFLEFVPNHTSAINFLKDYEKLYILKSMTKFHSSAGIRVGCLVSTMKNISKIQATQPAWKLSQFDISYLKYALDDKKFTKKSIKENIKNRKYLIKILEQSKYIKKVYKSDANFALVKLNNISTVEFQDIVSPYNIMVRDCTNFDFLDNRFVRIAVKEKSKLKMLKKAVCE